MAAALFLIAGSVYFLGALLPPTALVNVPMNEALATATVPADPQAALKLWSDFSVPWTWWNTLRTALGALNLLVVGLAIFVSGRPQPTHKLRGR